MCVACLGEIARAHSQFEVAIPAYEKALLLFRQVGDVASASNCTWGLGEIARMRSQLDAAQSAYEQALEGYRSSRSVAGEANCIQGLGDITRARGDAAGARRQYETALALYARIPEPYSIGLAHSRLAELAEGTNRAAHIAAARAARTSIDRPDLVARLGELG